jgi:Na+/melibiose symporter-like transporter
VLLDSSPDQEREPRGHKRAFSPGHTLLYGAGNVGAGTMFAFANAALPLYLAGYGLPNFAIGLLAQDRPPLAGLSQIVVGALSDRTRSRLGRRRPYILAGVPVTVAALLGLALHPPVWLMVLLLLVMTTALAVAYGPYLTLLRDLVPRRQRGRVGAVQTLGSMLGQLGILYLASQVWEQQEGLVFGVVAGALLVGFGLTFIGVREPPARSSTHPEQPRERSSLLDYVRGLLRHREAAKYMLPTLFFWLGTGSVVPFLTRFAVNELGTDESTAFQLLMVAIGTTALFTLPAGWAGDRWGKKPVLLAGLVAIGLVVLVGSQVRTVEQAVVALAATGAANGICGALLFPLLSDLIPGERAGEFTGFGTAAWELAQPLGAMLGGLSADLTGTLRTTLLVAGLTLLVAGALLVPVHPERSGEQGDEG